MIRLGLEMEIPRRAQLKRLIELWRLWDEDPEQPMSVEQVHRRMGEDRCHRRTIDRDLKTLAELGLIESIGRGQFVAVCQLVKVRI